jgi:rfaE bifunctional protein nucleotidyltransferase chain/domain
MNKKILPIGKLKKILKRQPRKKVVFTNGCFDILHYGHVKYLQRARSKGDLLVVGLNSDESVRRLKGAKRPLNTEKDRAAILAALSCVDFVVVFSDETPYKLIKTLEPRVLVKGGDWQKNKIVGADIVLRLGGKVLTIPAVKNRSTTNLIKKIKNQ